jgi:Pyridoxamine 5'-phosphate oxidase
MPKQRNDVQMTEAEVDGYLASQKIMTLATIGPSGAPHQVAMSYGLVDGLVVWWGYEKSQKVVNLRRDPRMSILVESGERGAEVKGVAISGTADIRTDPEYVLGIAGPAIFSQMRGQEVDGGVQEFLDKAGAKRIAVIVRPTRIRSWDHTKLNDYWLGKDPTAAGRAKAAESAPAR